MLCRRKKSLFTLKTITPDILEREWSLTIFWVLSVLVCGRIQETGEQEREFYSLCFLVIIDGVYARGRS
jgi:hypothetical protein